jgi:hypothetical protein
MASEPPDTRADRGIVDRQMPADLLRVARSRLGEGAAVRVGESRDLVRDGVRDLAPAVPTLTTIAPPAASRYSPNLGVHDRGAVRLDRDRRVRR